MSASRMMIVMSLTAARLTALSLVPSNADAFRIRERRVPNGQLDSLNAGGCGSSQNMCHVNPAGGGERQPFGDAFCYGSDSTRDPTLGCVDNWNLYMAMLDSDSDRYSNGEELGDSLGLYNNNTGTNPQPSAPDFAAGLAHNPSDPSSFPT